MADDLPDSTVLWRYMEWWKFAPILQHKIWFCRPWKFEDEWEGRLPAQFLERSRKAANRGYTVDEIELDYAKRLRIRKDAFLVNCWTIREDESLAMWDGYKDSLDGAIAIKANVGDVTYCLLEKHMTGVVRYYDPEIEIRVGLFSEDDIQYKLKKFDEEKEFRIWEIDFDRVAAIERDLHVKFEDGMGDDGRMLGITDLDRLIHKIVVAPGSSEAFLEAVKKCCADDGKNWLANRVERSSSEGR
jgi:hypothetical protein